MAKNDTAWVLGQAAASVLSLVTGEHALTCNRFLASEEASFEGNSHPALLIATCAGAYAEDLISLARLRQQGCRSPVLILCWQSEEVVRNRYRILQFGEHFHGYWRFPFRLCEAVKTCNSLSPMSRGNLALLQQSRVPIQTTLARIESLLAGLAQHPENAEQTVAELEAIRNRLLRETSLAMHGLVVKEDGSGTGPLYSEMEACIGRLGKPRGLVSEQLIARLRLLFDKWADLADLLGFETLEAPRDS